MPYEASRLHRDNVLKVAERHRLRGLPQSVAVDYDERCRREWASRTAKRDSAFSLTEAVKEVDKAPTGFNWQPRGLEKSTL